MRLPTGCHRAGAGAGRRGVILIVLSLLGDCLPARPVNAHPFAVGGARPGTEFCSNTRTAGRQPPRTTTNSHHKQWPQTATANSHRKQQLHRKQPSLTAASTAWPKLPLPCRAAHSVCVVMYLRPPPYNQMLPFVRADSVCQYGSIMSGSARVLGRGRWEKQGGGGRPLIQRVQSDAAGECVMTDIPPGMTGTIYIGRTMKGYGGTHCRSDQLRDTLNRKGWRGAYR